MDWKWFLHPPLELFRKFICFDMRTRPLCMQYLFNTSMWWIVRRESKGLELWTGLTRLLWIFEKLLSIGQNWSGIQSSRFHSDSSYFCKILFNLGFLMALGLLCSSKHIQLPKSSIFRNPVLLKSFTCLYISKGYFIC